MGDGANDLPMLNAAGFGVACHAKPKVQAEAPFKINFVGLDGVLNYFK
jgi:phosphoserine phosphatase